jgi:small conductance mechanosensitive channel
VEPPDLDPLPIDAPDDLGAWVLAVVVLVVGALVARLTGRVTRRILRRAGVEASLAVLFSRGLAWALTGIALFYALSVLGVQLGPVIGALGIGGLVVALALQGILQNVFAGVILQARRPFVIGDEIESAEHRGRVVDISSRVVRIESFTGEDVFIPNSEVLDNVIVNQTRPGRRRLDLRVQVAYGTDLDQACAVAERAVREVPGIRVDPPIRCFAEEFEESGVVLELLAWHDPPERVRWQVRSDAVIAVHLAFAEAGITIPFPQRTVWLRDGNVSRRDD